MELALVRGYSVYAGCLNEKGMSALAARAKAALVQEKEKGEGKKGGRPRIGALGDGGRWRVDSLMCVL